MDWLSGMLCRQPRDSTTENQCAEAREAFVWLIIKMIALRRTLDNCDGIQKVTAPAPGYRTGVHPAASTFRYPTPLITESAGQLMLRTLKKRPLMRLFPRQARACPALERMIAT